MISLESAFVIQAPLLMAKDARNAQLIPYQILLKLLVNALMLDKNTMMPKTPAMINVLKPLKFGIQINVCASLDTAGGTQPVESALITLILIQLKQLVSVKTPTKSMMPAETPVKIVKIMPHLTQEKLDVYAIMALL